MHYRGKFFAVINNLYNNLVSKAFKVLKRNKVSNVFIGDVKGIRKDKDWGRKGNKMLHNYWTYDALYHKCSNKSDEYGMEYNRDTIHPTWNNFIGSYK